MHPNYRPIPEYWSLPVPPILSLSWTKYSGCWRTACGLTTRPDLPPYVHPTHVQACRFLASSDGQIWITVIRRPCHWLLAIKPPPPPGPSADMCCVSHSVVSILFAAPWTASCQAPLSMEFSRQEYWSGLPFPSLGDLPNPGIRFGSPTVQANSLQSEPPGKPLLS